MPERKLIGKGDLNWRRGERVSDRYGSVCLYELNPTFPEETVKLNRYEGYGKLIAIIKETRKSDHIGDMFRGLHPSTPEIDEVIELGEGTIFYGVDEYGDMVGLKPADNREEDWLNPQSLYRCHSQTVELYFEGK